MKNLWFIGFLLLLVGCEEANDIFGYEEYYGRHTIEVLENRNDMYYDGPVHIDATSWGTMAYIGDAYVNKGVKLLISESSNAEGGKELDVTSNAMAVTGLSQNTQYYYCLCIPSGNIKSDIKSVVVPDVSALDLEIMQSGDWVKCVIQDSISPALIVEKGFKLDSWSESLKVVVKGDDFAFSVQEYVKKHGVMDYLYVYAYVQTANAYYCSSRIEIPLGDVPSGDVGAVNREDVTVSVISEDTIEEVDYLKCTVTGYVDSVYFRKDWGNETKFYPDKTVVSEDGGSTTFYLKKSWYRDVQLIVFYKVYWDENSGDYYEGSKESETYTPTQFNIRTLEDFMAFVLYSDEYWDSEKIFTLLADITLPSDLRLNIPLSGTLEGNGHTIDGVSYFPLFRNVSYHSVVKNLKIGKDDTVYDVKEGTHSVNTTRDEVPPYLLVSDYVDEGTFVDCEVRGTIKVTGRDSFSLSPVTIPGLKDYTKTEYVTTDN